MDRDDFDRFLNWLDPDPNRAGAKYEDIRRKLIRFFLCRGCGVDTDALADETIERVTNKIQRLADTYEGDPFRYFFGVARNVFREWLKIQLDLRELQPPPAGESTEEKEEHERLDQCLQQCLKRLSPEEQHLILEYYSGERQQKIVNRKKLSEELGIAPNALRIRAHRIRTELRSCVEKCLEEEKDDETDSRNDH